MPRIAPLLLLTLTLCPLASAQAPSTTPATGPGDPKTVAKAFVAALAQGDIAAAKSMAVFTSNDPAVARQEERVVEATSAMMDGFRKLDTAAVAKLGDAAKSLQIVSPSAQAIRDIEDGRVVIDGERAAIVGPSEDKPLRLARVDGVWKVDMTHISSQEKDLRTMAALLEGLGQAASETADDISADRFRDVGEVRQAMQTRLRSAMLKAAASSTQPATTP